LPRGEKRLLEHGTCNRSRGGLPWRTRKTPPRASSPDHFLPDGRQRRRPGGVFTGIVAPRSFNGDYELAIGLVLTTGTVLSVVFGRYAGRLNPVLRKPGWLAIEVVTLAVAAMLAFHITNMSLDLRPVLAQVEQQFGKEGYVVVYSDGEDARGTDWAVWVLITTDETRIALERLGQPLQTIQTREGINLWRDDYSSVFSVLR